MAEPSVQDMLFFSALAYEGPIGTESYNQILNNYGYTDWTCLQQSPANADSYFGLAFQNTVTHDIVVANRGSSTSQDWSVTDKDIVEQTVAPAFTDALDFANDIEASNANSTIFTTGHSLGGAEAQYVAAQLQVAGVTFSAPGVQWAAPGVSADVDNYVFAGEPIGEFGSHIGSVITILPNGPLQLASAAGSDLIDALLPEPVLLAVGFAGPNWALHLIGNYLEHFDVAPPPPASDTINPEYISGPEGIVDLVGALASDLLTEPQSTLPVSSGGTATITRAFLLSTDRAYSDSELTYTVLTSPRYGSILVNGTAADTFTQADIDNGRVEYRQDGSVATSDNFIFQVNDPIGSHVGPEAFTIAIVDTNQPDVFANGPGTVDVSGTGIIWKNTLCTVALGNDPADMKYSVVAGPAHGSLLLNGAATTTFTQDDIDHGRLWFAENGEIATGDSFSFSVTDRAGDQTPIQTFNIVIDPRPVSLDPPAGWRAIGAGDFDGDAKRDFLWQDNADASTEIWLAPDQQGTAPQVIATPPIGWHGIAVADFDGDGKSDILWQNDDGRAAIWLMDCLASKDQAIVGTPPAEWRAIDAADFNGDGKADILWQKADGTTAIWLMDGMKTTFEDIVGTPPPDWHAQGASDRDGDGKADILWQNDDGRTGVWLMDGTHPVDEVVFAAPTRG